MSTQPELQTSKLELRPDPRGGKGAKRLFVTYSSRKGATLEWSPRRDTLSADLASLADEALDGREVEFEIIAGHPDRIRAKGADFKAPSLGGPSSAAHPAAGPPGRRDQGRPTQNRPGQGRPGQGFGGQRPGGGRPEPPRRTPSPAFHNPYNFIPAPIRDQVTGDLGDHRPASQQAYQPGHWSGRLTVTLTTVTPLLLPDAARVQTDPNGHKTFGVRRRPDGAPYLPPTSVKGMLRAAYEAITNSRFGVFNGHDDRLGLRMEAAQGLAMVPAAVTLVGDELQVRLLPGDANIGDDGRPKGNLMYAAWLPRYRVYPNNDRNPPRDKGESAVALAYSAGTLPAHGDQVWVQVRTETHRSGRFKFLRVTAIRQATPGAQPPAGWRAGIVCITGRNIKNKHDERVFLEGGPGMQVIRSPGGVKQELVKAWNNLIADYRQIHEDDLAKRQRSGHSHDDYLGHEPGKTGWSNHIFEPDRTRLREDEPVLCYARVSRGRDGLLVHRLYPVMISRDIFARSPADLLHDSVSPAQSLDHLSPADRVFGWVHADAGKAPAGAPTAWRGQLRVGPVRCPAGAEAIEGLPGGGVPLAILGQPKPQQVRFYVGGDQIGSPLADGTSKDQGYQPGQGPRGRKVYPHHRHLNDWPGYWQNPTDDRTQQPVPHPARPQGRRYHQEYRRPDWRDRGEDKTRDDQNRSITEWVKPKVDFTFNIDVLNLAPAELGALLWLLTLPEGHYLRLGGGKPLGFGSVRLQLTAADLRDGDACRDDYRHLRPRPPTTPAAGHRITEPTGPAIAACIQDFEEAVITGYPAARFDAVPFIKAFLVAARGFGDDLPVHYPRVDAAPNPEGKNFLWFTANDSRFGFKLGLGALHLTESGLPLVPKSE